MSEKNFNNNNQNNNEEDAFYAYIPYIAFTIIAYVILGIFSKPNSSIFSALSAFSNFLEKIIGGFYPLVMIALGIAYIGAVYVFMQKNSPKRINFSDETSYAGIFFLLIGSLLLWGCFATFPICLLFTYFSLKDGISLFNKYNKIPTSVELEEEEVSDSFKKLEDYEKNCLEKLRSEDFKFNLDFFQNRVIRMFKIINGSIYTNKFNRAEEFLSDGLIIKLKHKVFEGFKSSKNPYIEEPEITNIAVLLDDTDKNYDTVVACIKTKVPCYINKLFDFKTKPESEKDSTISVMKLVRRKRINSTMNGLVERCCPSCGKKLEILDSCQCPFCNISLRSCKNDWIVSDLDVHRGNPEDLINLIKGKESTIIDSKNMLNIFKYDPEFSIRNIEDKLQYMFHTIVFAHNSSFKKRVDSFTTPELAKKLFQSYLKNVFSNSVFVKINSIEIKGMYTEKEKDFLVCKLSWEGRAFEESLSSVPSITFFILTRNSNVATNTELLFSSSYCSNCGQKTVNFEQKCELCGNTINNENLDWVLYDVFSSEHPLTRNYIRNINKQNYNDKQSKICNFKLLSNDSKEKIKATSKIKEKVEIINSDYNFFNKLEIDTEDFNNFITKFKQEESNKTKIIDKNIKNNVEEDKIVKNTLSIDDKHIEEPVKTVDSNNNVSDNKNIEIDKVDSVISDNGMQNVEINNEIPEIEKIDISSNMPSTTVSPAIKEVSVSDIGISKVEINLESVNTNIGMPSIEIKPVSLSSVGFNSGIAISRPKLGSIFETQEEKKTEVNVEKKTEVNVEKKVEIKEEKKAHRPEDKKVIKKSKSSKKSSKKTTKKISDKSIKKVEKKVEIIHKEKPNLSQSKLSETKSSLLGVINIGSSGMDLTKRIDISASSILSSVNINPIVINPVKLDSEKNE